MYETPTIEPVGGQENYPDSPVVFAAVVAVVAAAALVAVWWYAYVVEFQEIWIASPP